MASMNASTTFSNESSSDVSEQPLSTKENMLWNSAGNFIYLVAQWLLTYLVVRMLGYENAGYFSLAMTIGTSFYCIASYTMRNFQVSDVTDEFSAHAYLQSRHLTCGIAVFACMLFAFANNYDAYTLACIASYMLFKTSEALADVYHGMMQKKLRMDYIGISFAIKGICELALFSAALAMSHDLLVAIVALTAVSYLVVISYDRHRALCNVLFSKPTWSDIGRLLITCLPVALFGFFFNASAQLPRYYLEMMLGAEQLGYYTSIAMPVVIVQVFASYLFAPITTPMALHLRDGNWSGFMGLLYKVLAAIAALAVVALGAFGFLGDWLLGFLFGSSIAPYTHLLIPLVICTILTALAWFLSAVITVLRKLRFQLTLSIASFAVSAIGSIPFIAYWGLNGASFILIVSLAMFVVGCSVCVFREAARIGRIENHGN